MKNKIYQYICIAFLLAALPSCQDFLEISDKGSVSPKIFPSTMEQVNLMLTASYAGSHTKGLYTFYWFPMGIYLYDKTSNLDATYDLRGTQLNNNTDLDCEYNTQTYSDIFRWVELSNAALEAIDQYWNDDLPDTQKEELNYMKGQALFNRALAYWHGQIYFEIDPNGWGLPLFNKVPKTIEEMMAPRATTKDSWDFIIQTLKEAIPHLIGKTDPTRATEWAAKGLLAKVYMQAGYKAEAQALLEEIITKSGKKLVPFTVYSAMFYGDPANEFNEETLYEIDMSINEKQNGPWAGYTTGSGMPMVFAPWPLNLKFRDKPSDTEFDIITNATGGWGNNYIHDANIRRFGFTLGPPPVKRVKNPNFDSRAERSIDNLPYILDPVYHQASIDERANTDPRLSMCAAQPYVDTFLDDMGRPTYYDKSPGLNQFPQIMAWNHKKFTNLLGYENQKNFSSDANYPIVRLADIYLLYAEVVKDTDPAKALEYINKVHRRAYNYPVDAPSPVDYKSLNGRTKAAPEDHLANDVLKYERWAELFAEGQWWFDIRRWKIGEQEVKYYKEARNGPLSFRSDDYYVQPIPKTEVERYNGKIEQSGNY
ncbi:MAG: RagB/SusD family nutrient uptake outer membrane protein [Dysgonamonadaceae bacterium]|jgi:hypothetical protein|nr:RagB/SusD family nutrient uptake outer membrane protein [Dysgonamonadaceae bacterium]